PGSHPEVNVAAEIDGLAAGLGEEAMLVVATGAGVDGEFITRVVRFGTQMVIAGVAVGEVDGLAVAQQDQMRLEQEVALIDRGNGLRRRGGVGAAGLGRRGDLTGRFVGQGQIDHGPLYALIGAMARENLTVSAGGIGLWGLGDAALVGY